MIYWEEILSEKSFLMSFSSASKNTYWGGTVVIVLHCKPYVITASSRHLVASMQVPITACSLCNTQRRARKTLWQYAASKRMHLFIHRFIYVHISLRADIIQITKFRKWAASRVLSSILPDFGWYLVYYKSFFFFLYFCKIAKHQPHCAKPPFTLTASVNRASIRRSTCHEKPDTLPRLSLESLAPVEHRQKRGT